MIPKAVVDFAKEQGKGLDRVIKVANECNITSEEFFSILDTGLLNEYVRWLEEQYELMKLIMTAFNGLKEINNSLNSFIENGTH